MPDGLTADNLILCLDESLGVWQIENVRSIDSKMG